MSQAISPAQAIDTPRLEVSREVLVSNIERMASLARKHGVSLRPHIKTHKCAEIARMQLEAGAVGVTVASTTEAEVMWQAGAQDIFVAYPLVGEVKIARLLALAQAGARLSTSVDSLAVAQPLAAAFHAIGQELPVVMKIDTGLGRTGVGPGQPALALAAEIARMPGVRLEGIFTHEGHVGHGGSKEVPDAASLRAASAHVRGQMVSTADMLRKEGFACSRVSIGSTPGTYSCDDFRGITEIRPGTYVFHDRSHCVLGQAEESWCALHVKATVVSRPTPTRAVIDAGSKTFSSNRSPYVPGYGLVVGLPGAEVISLNEEHGVITLSRPGEEPRVGSFLEVIPNHVCEAVNLANEFWVQSARGEEVWSIAARGCSR